MNNNLKLELDTFIIYLQKEKGYSANTLDAYQRDLLKFNSFLISYYDLSSLTYKTVDKWAIRNFLGKEEEEGKSSKTRRRCLASIRSFFKFLNKELRYYGAQGLNILPIVEPITKFSKTITDPYSIQYYLEKALYYSLEGRPGPVWLDIPFDVQSAIIADPSKMRMFKPPPRIDASIDETTSQVDLIMKKITNAKNPLFIAGQGVRQGDAIEEFKKIIELFDAPFLVSRVAIDIFKASYRNNLGLAGMKGSRYSQKIMDESDLILSMGCSMNVAFTNESEMLFPNAEVIMVNNDKNEFDKPGLNLDMKVLLDVKSVLQKMLKKAHINKNKQFT